MPISWLDVILIIIMLVSGFLAMVRGFTREVLSIFSWAVGAVAGIYAGVYWAPQCCAWAQAYVSPKLWPLVFGLSVGILTLIVVSLITFHVSDRVLDSRVGALDRTMGFIFGLARGFLLVAIVFILFSALARDQPTWITEARSYGILKQTQVAIESLMPTNPDELLPGGSKTGETPEGQPAAPDAPSDAAPAAPPPDQRSEGPKLLEPVVWTRAAYGIEAPLRAPI
jgi:membrane protein required for colicin V production